MRIQTKSSMARFRCLRCSLSLREGCSHGTRLSGRAIWMGGPLSGTAPTCCAGLRRLRQLQFPRYAAARPHLRKPEPRLMQPPATGATSTQALPPAPAKRLSGGSAAPAAPVAAPVAEPVRRPSLSVQAARERASSSAGPAPGAPPTDPDACADCHEKIVGPRLKLEALGLVFHPDHFTCTVCSIPMQGQPCMPKNGAVYCRACYNAKFLNKCHTCQQPIASQRYVNVFGRFYHVEHFTCHGCKDVLEGKQYAAVDDPAPDAAAGAQVALCAGCYEDRFSPTCSRCGKKTGSECVEASGKSYHKECFACSECEVQLRGEDGQTTPYYLQDDATVCEPCFMRRHCPKCETCGEGIVEDHVAILDNTIHFHNHHFMCFLCQSDLNGDAGAGGIMCVGTQACCAKCFKSAGDSAKRPLSAKQESCVHDGAAVEEAFPLGAPEHLGPPPPPPSGVAGSGARNSFGGGAAGGGGIAAITLGAGGMGVGGSSVAALLASADAPGRPASARQGSMKTTCAEPGCRKKRMVRGFCADHYRNARQMHTLSSKNFAPVKVGGQVDTERPPLRPDQACKVFGCAEEGVNAGFCAGHYKQVAIQISKAPVHKVTMVGVVSAAKRLY
jgi:hypothetical protein